MIKQAVPLLGIVFSLGVWLPPAQGEPAQRTLMPPQLAKSFLEKAYRGKSVSSLYSRMSNDFQKQVSPAQFKKNLRARRSVGAGTRFSLKLQRQEALASSAGLLYYIVQVRYPFFSFKNNFYALERFHVELQNGEWKLAQLPTRLIVGDMKKECTQSDYRILYGFMEQDRARETLDFSRRQAVSRSLSSAQELAQKKEFRRALVEYQKILQLEKENPEALQGSAFCREQLAKNENAD